jgi:GH35 family endo-1,4-beta-xylanase
MEFLPTQIDSWIVAEHMLNDDEAGTFRDMLPWFPNITNFQEETFKLAAKYADPSVRLFLSDALTDNNKDGFFHIVRKLKENGVPIHGVGQFNCLQYIYIYIYNGINGKVSILTMILQDSSCIWTRIPV